MADPGFHRGMSLRGLGGVDAAAFRYCYCLEPQAQDSNLVTKAVDIRNLKNVDVFPTT